jgi:ABC-type thiamine transport system ATPase subunit
MIFLKGYRPQKLRGLFVVWVLLLRPIGSKAYDCLSQGEKMRVDIAHALCLNQPLIVFDEFTSVVDREIAKVSAYAISKAVRRSNKKFIAVTCHYDVVDWLEPDWVFCTDTMEFSRKKDVGRPLNSKFIGAALAYGRCFGSITI